MSQLTSKVKSLETTFYGQQSSKTEADRKFFLASVNDTMMNEFYDSLSPYVPRETSVGDSFQNAVVSGAGMVLSPAYVAKHAPRINFGSFSASSLQPDFKPLGETSQAIESIALSEGAFWGDMSQGKLQPTVMWIDDQITAEYAVTNLGANKLVLQDPAPGAYIVKQRAPPSNPAWYTLAVYLPTLFSGFILLENVRNRLGGKADWSALAPKYIESFCNLFPSESIGQVYCAFIQVDEVALAIEQAARVEQYWAEVLNPAWEELLANQTVMDNIGSIIHERLS